ncbi:UBP-type zinc finger domain-containing protein [Larkinella insperata]|uniref:UBP-type zinc finger domain-containing protein n=1 Tax=Larkinella insperata TaxID=332158 RepID=A0ABW3Q983_9BACT|nr:UBP-type zinc finger domain-containing protein [Larkinella insperata]
MLKRKSCSHLNEVETVALPGQPAVCEECVKTGDSWVHLRTCQTCGKTHCCDSSPNQHATKHFHGTGHPVIASAEPGESWLWCYVDELITPYAT